MKRKSLSFVAALLFVFTLAFAAPRFAHAATIHVQPLAALACGSGTEVDSLSYTSAGTTYDGVLEYDASCDKYFAIGLRTTAGSLYLEVDDAYNPSSAVTYNVAAWTIKSTGEIPDSETLHFCVGPGSSSYECATW